MRIRIIGAGPSGLYLAILLKKANADHDITVLERNPPNATFGWGVVFSEETLGALREADHPSYLDITATFAHWDAIDISYRATLQRCRGHAFSAISRKRLLGILQRRCADLGVELRFGVEIDDPDTAGADLEGHRLMSNKSSWLTFPRIRNRNWHNGNTVLIGDAAHTAHFTIGSGTKLAMEDAIALAQAIAHRGDDAAALRAALTDYESDRQPVVERFQRAAGESADYFARVHRHDRLAPRQFAMNLLTRSGRIGHANLTVRDPDFVRTADTEFAGGEEKLFGPPPALAPLHLRGTTVPNRIVLLAAGPIGLAESARRGAGLVLAGPVAVSEEGRVSPDTANMEGPWAEAVARVHAEGALAGIRLAHAGRRGATRPAHSGVDIALPKARSWPLLAASALPYGPGCQVPKAMTQEDIERVRAAFATAASHAAVAGFDVLELDCAHGGLLAGFLSPLSNLREDDYGGDPARRLRYPLDVLAAVRAAAPDRVLTVRLSVTDWAARGNDTEAGIEIAAAMVANGADLVHVEAGQTAAGAHPVYRRGFLTTLSDRVRSEAAVPTLVGGYLTTLDEVNTALSAGRADLCIVDFPGEAT